MPLSQGLDSRLRGNDGIGLPLQHGFFRFYVLDSRLRGNDGIGLPLQHGFFRFYVLDSRLRGNDGGAVSVFSDKFLKLKISSFLQKQKTK
ncbi:TPA: hypothetical protein ACJJKD_002073, partial [Neisseria meningitidis]